jgi:chemotaxis protein MotB
VRFNIFLVLFMSLWLSGCVSKSNYQIKVDEATELTERVAELETRNEELQGRILALSQERSDLRSSLSEAGEINSALQQDLRRARADLDRLETVLSARSAEAGAALAEMRRTIDRLQEENRNLALLVEQERIAREARVAQMKSTFDELMDKMESEIARGEITISELKGRLTVNMVDRILFDTGQSEIKSAGLEVLKRVGDILRQEEDKEIVIEGHTDNVPISARLRQTFPTNWELSAARAINVVHYLQGRVGIPGERLTAVGLGPYRPVSPNDTPEGRAQNRRIQIILVPLEGRALETGDVDAEI